MPRRPPPTRAWRCAVAGTLFAVYLVALLSGFVLTHARLKSIHKSKKAAEPQDVVVLNVPAGSAPEEFANTCHSCHLQHRRCSTVVLLSSQVSNFPDLTVCRNSDLPAPAQPGHWA